MSTPLADAASLEFPCIAYASFDYSATGEGRTLGLLVMHAGSADDLVGATIREFGDFYALDATIGYWHGTPPGLEPLDPRIALESLKKLFVASPMYRYSAKLHYNLA